MDLRLASYQVRNSDESHVGVGMLRLKAHLVALDPLGKETKMKSVSRT